MDLHEFLLQMLFAELTQYEEKTRNLAKDRDGLIKETDCPLSFKIQILSGWALYGEKTMVHVGHGTLENSMREAIEKFERENKRSDVQGRYIVHAVLPHGSEIMIPHHFYGHYHEKYGQYSLPTERVDDQ